MDPKITAKLKGIVNPLVRILSPERISAGRKRLQSMIDKAGLPLTAEQFGRAITSTALALTFVLTLFEVYFFRKEGVSSYTDLGVYIVVMWILSFVSFSIMLWMGFFMYMDIRKMVLSRELLRLHGLMKEKETVQPNAKNVSPILWRKSVVERIVGLFKKKSSQEKETESLDEKSTVSKHEHLRRMEGYFQKAGFYIDFHYVSRHIFRILMVIIALITVYELSYFSLVGTDSIAYVLAITALIWIPLFLVTWIVLWLAFVIYLDIRIFKRRIGLEEVLPDFLQLTSSNMKAGMTIDRALWFAVRPRFGVLAKEIEEVAKRTLSGEPLEQSLRDFANRYDSLVLHRSVDILIEGIQAGGNIGNILNKIAINIQEMNSLKKEMGANVTTYVIFIGFATLIAAPILFALSTHLLLIVNNITENLDTGSSQGGSFVLSISTEGGIALSDYQWFTRISLILTAMFSAIIISTIQKGNLKEGAHYIPIFIITTQLVYLVSYYLLGGMLGAFFGT